jgi:hypothetical protein
MAKEAKEVEEKKRLEIEFFEIERKAEIERKMKEAEERKLEQEASG